MMEEVWKDIEGYEGIYQVSNLGRVRSLDRNTVRPHPRNASYQMNYFRKGKMKSQRLNNMGYFVVDLCDGHSNQRTRLVHRLVASAFLPNPNNLSCVNHKDENPKHNSVDNLEWCTHQYNINYGTAKYRNGRKHWVPVIQMSLDGEFIKEWPSAQIAADTLGGHMTHIVAVCRGKARTHIGFRWRYAESKPRRPF